MQGRRPDHRKPDRRKPGPDRGRTRERERERAHQRPGGQASDDFIKVSGLAAVEALFARAPQSVERLFFTDEYKNHLAPFCRELSAARKTYRLVDSEELARIAGTKLNGGVVAATRPREVRSFEQRMAAEWAQDGKPLLVLDGVGNPHNLGAIARTLAFFGLPRLLISSHPDQAGPSEAAIRVSEGGLIWTDLFRATSLPDALRALKPHYLVIGTALGRGTTLERIKADKRPVAFVLGNEERGLPDATIKACEALITLPGSGRVQSLNVAATAAILVFFAANQRRDF